MSLFSCALTGVYRVPNQYWVKAEGNVVGPLSSDEVKEMADSGQIHPSAEFSLDGDTYRAVSTVKSLYQRILDAHADVEDEFTGETEPSEANGVFSGHDADRQEQSQEGDAAEAVEVTSNAEQGSSFSVFISYRRGQGAEIARLIKEKLERAGFSVFLDVDDLREGDWNEALQARIEECTDFIPVVTGGFFDRCADTSDIVRRELELAMTSEKNIVPLLVAEDAFPVDIPSELSQITQYNGVRYVGDYINECCSKLIRMLKSSQLGIERLSTDEVIPKRVVSICGYLLTIIYGSVPYFGIGLDTFLIMLVRRPVTAVVFAIPLLGALFGASIAYKTDANKLYCGREWIVFWLCFVPAISLVSLISATGAATVFSLLFSSEDGQQYSIRNLIGMVAAFAGVKIFLGLLYKKQWWRVVLRIMPPAS